MPQHLTYSTRTTPIARTHRLDSRVCGRAIRETSSSFPEFTRRSRSCSCKNRRVLYKRFSSLTNMSQVGSSSCQACTFRPSHRLAPCQHTVCYDHCLAGFDAESSNQSLCGMCRQASQSSFTKPSLAATELIFPYSLLFPSPSLTTTTETFHHLRPLLPPLQLTFPSHLIPPTTLFGLPIRILSLDHLIP